MKQIFLFLTILAMVACHSRHHENAIPRTAIALVTIDPTAANADEQQSEEWLKWLNVDDAKDCGIDLQAPLYLFESADANMGLCAAVADENQLDSWVKQTLTKDNTARTIDDRKGFHFAVIKDAWLMGYSDEALLVMGPVVAEGIPSLQQQMVKQLSAGEEEGVRGGRLWDVADTLSAPVTIVAQAQALPEQVAAPLCLGAPRDAEPSQVYVRATMTPDKDILLVDAAAFAFQEKIQQTLKENAKVWQMPKGRFYDRMGANDVAAFFARAKGSEFLRLLHTQKTVETMLTGINAVIDMDAVLRSVDGDIAFFYRKSEGKDFVFRFMAELDNTDFLSQVDYWKKSVPKGSTISNDGEKMYRYKDGHNEVRFGVDADGCFVAETLPADSTAGMTADLKGAVEGHSPVMALRLPALLAGNEVSEWLMPLLKPITGGAQTIVYRANY